MEAAAELYEQVAPLHEKINLKYRLILILIALLLFVATIAISIAVVFEVFHQVTIIGIVFIGLTALLQFMTPIFGNNGSQKSMKGWFIVLLIFAPVYLLISLMESII